MKLLLDTCISPRTKNQLVAAGNDVIWVGDWEADPGDDSILDRALRESRILVTLDKDFGELAIILGRKHAGIIRLVDIPLQQQAVACLRTLDRYNQFLQAGALLTVQPGRTRIRPPEDDTPEQI
jgi:predicted nuclease of predicted toxin-antitoxin system